MARCAVIHFLCVLGVFHKGLTALIETQHTVKATVGHPVCLNCHLTQSRDVLQVTWQMILPEGERNLASYSRFYGETVNAPFQSKLEFKDADLLNSSIVIRRVMEEDEGCYRCMFITASEGALKATTCLQLYELHGPFLLLRESVVSCSATAPSAPTLTLTVLHYNSTTVTNANGTVTVTATARLSGLRDNGTQVRCAVTVFSGPQIEVFTVIPGVKGSSADGFDEESGSNNSDDFYFTLIVVFVVVACVCVCVCVAAAVVIVLLKRKHLNRPSHRDSEENKTPQKHTHELKTPITKEENELRKRTPAEKVKNFIQPKTSSLEGRKLIF